MPAVADPTLAASADSSRRSGDASAGELVLALLALVRLLALASLLERDVLRGETLPVCFGRVSKHGLERGEGRGKGERRKERVRIKEM
jgi:hypothetical protein